MRAALGLALCALTACNASSGHEHVTFAHLAFDVPGAWSNHDEVRRGVSTTMWTPEDNANKESITVIRTHAVGAVPQAGIATLDRLIKNATENLPGARVAGIVPVRTEHGLQGVRVDVSYVPPSTHERYRRIHVVLVDADRASLVLVMYTAKIADQQLEALELVLSTIREEG